MSKFKHTTQRRADPDPAALEAFAAGAESRSVELSANTELRSSANSSSRIYGITEQREAVMPSKKVTVMLDRERWLALKQTCASEDKSGQRILVDALDLYLATNGTGRVG